MINSKSTTILIIEDDEEVQDTLSDILELNDYNAVLANNGQEGLRVAKREKPAVIITDLAMPVMSGFEFLEARRIDQDLRIIPVIVISAKVDREANRRAMELGASDFLTKPFREEEVIHSIATRLEQRELLDELDAFAHTVAHDLRNPLATLMGRVELAGMMLGKISEEETRSHLAIASKTAYQLNGILESLLVLSGVRRQSVASEEIDMATIANEAVDRLEAMLKEHSAEVMRPEVWPVAYGYGPWVIEIWVNFVSNAAKYGGDSPRIKLGGDLSSDGATSRFWVQDNGPGLNAEQQELMFIPFTNLSKIQAKGHGLGLSIVRRIVEKLGGKVGVESEPGAGACFWFELPAKALPPSSMSATPFAL